MTYSIFTNMLPRFAFGIRIEGKRVAWSPKMSDSIDLLFWVLCFWLVICMSMSVFPGCLLKRQEKTVKIGLLMLDFVVDFHEICVVSWMVCCARIIA